jgi:hypothetical protein
MNFFDSHREQITVEKLVNGEWVFVDVDKETEDGSFRINNIYKHDYDLCETVAHAKERRDVLLFNISEHEERHLNRPGFKTISWEV